MRKRRQSIEERKQLGLQAQTRAGSLNQIEDPRLRRAIDALTSLENFDLDSLGFTADGKLTVSPEFVRETVDLPDPVTVSIELPRGAVATEAALSVEGSALTYRQKPIRMDLPASALLADVITQLNGMLEDERRSGHRRR